MRTRALALLLLAARVGADSSAGAAFLRIGDGARPLALGGAYTAASGSVDSLYYNPAGLAMLNGKELSLTHSDWLQGTSFDVASYGQATAYGTFGVSALRLGGTQEGRDALRQKTGDFTTQDIAAVFSYSKAVGTWLGAGANVKYLHSQIASDNASTYAVDAGAVARVPDSPLSFGAAILNIGEGFRFMNQADRLPLTIAAGAVYTPVERLNVSLDVKHEPYGHFSELDMGGEYTIGIFSFRAGYVAPVQGVDTTLQATECIRGGLGLQISRYRADYTLAPFGDLGLTQRFTFGILFGAGASDSSQPHNLQSHSQARLLDLDPALIDVTLQ